MRGMDKTGKILCWVAAVMALGLVGNVVERCNHDTRPEERAAHERVRVAAAVDVVCYNDFGDVFRAVNSGEFWARDKVRAREAVLIPAGERMEVVKVLPGNRYSRIFGVRWKGGTWYAFESNFTELPRRRE